MPSYTTGAIEAMNALGDRAFANGFSGMMVSELRKSVKFRLPLNAELITRPEDVHESLLAAFRLPFPSISIEYDTDLPGECGNIIADRVVTFAEDVGSLSRFAADAGIYGAPDEDGFVLYSISRHVSGKWVPSTFACLVPYNQSGDVPRGANKVRMFPFELSGDYPSRARAAGAHISAKSMVNEYYLDASAVLNVALCSMCENVGHDVIREPKHTNRTRVKKGKEPFFEYRILKVVGSGASGSGAVSGRGVRMHLRRGHIRRLPGGKFTWVKNCVVGDVSRGVIEKDYDLSCR